MHIRQKNGSVRISMMEPGVLTTIPYVLIDPTECWCSTYNSWGKKTDSAVISLGGKNYRVVLEEVK
jgi:hypothetical protein